MPIPLEKRKTIFANGVPKYSSPPRTEYTTTLTREFGGQIVPTRLELRPTTLGITQKGTGYYNPKGYPIPPSVTNTEVFIDSTALYLDKLNKYNYNQRFNDVLTGDSRGRNEKYPPDILVHKTGGEGYFGSGIKYDDMFIRGGFVQSTAIALEDVARVGNFYASTKGALWILREQGLQMTNPRPETRIFNPLTLLLNVGSQHLGIHLPRHGLNPFVEGDGGLLSFGYNTYAGAKDYEAGGKDYSRSSFIATTRSQPKLLDLYSEMFLGNRGLSIIDPTNFAATGLSYLKALAGINVSKSIPPRDRASNSGDAAIETINYLAKANSTYGGINLTGAQMSRVSNTQFDFEGKPSFQSPPDKYEAGSSLVNQIAKLAFSPPSLPSVDTLLGGAINKVLGTPNSLEVDTSKDLLKIYKSLAYGELDTEDNKYVSTTRDRLEGPTQNYKASAKIQGLGRVASLKSHALPKRGFADAGALSSPSGDSLNAMKKLDYEVFPGDVNDLVPLIFYDIKDDTSIVFRAVLKGITDTVTPEWNEYNYIGNPQTYYTYKRTIRDFGFTFTVYTNTERELRWNWMKLNRFVGMVYPNFDSGNRMVGPVLRLTMGNLLMRTPGYISALTITVDDNTPWEINLYDDENLAKLPHAVECQVTFRVIGDTQLSSEAPFFAHEKMYEGNWTWDKWEA